MHTTLPICIGGAILKVVAIYIEKLFYEILTPRRTDLALRIGSGGEDNQEDQKSKHFDAIKIGKRCQKWRVQQHRP